MTLSNKIYCMIRKYFIIVKDNKDIPIGKTPA